MNAQEWKQLLSAYADGAVSAQEAEAAQKLLAERPECRQYLDELRKVSLHLQAFKDENLSPDSEIKMRTKLKKERPMTAVNQWKSAGLVAASVLVVVLAYNAQPVPSTPVGDQFSPATTSARPIAATRMMQAQTAKVQYEPYYQQSNYAVAQDALATSMVAYDATSIAPYPYYPSVQEGNTEEYSKINDNQFLSVANDPLSTFSIDVDTASYGNVRRFLTQNQMPPKDAVRIEEMVNYFSYNYPKPEGNDPFSITTDLAVCPWNKEHQLLRIGLRGRTPDLSKVPLSNLVFLIDVSGSMDSPDKLPLLKEAFKMMVDQLRPQDKVSIVVYAGNAGQVLEPTSGDQKEKIKAALDGLQAGGSTAGGEGMALAYRLAKENFIKEGNNRVVWATDGDFNVGVSSTSELVRIMEEKRKDGIFLTLLGFGGGNLKDSRMQQLADQGNGNYFYIDTIKEARKVLVNELGSTLYTIAKDVKIQIEFNPAAVKNYRLVGYEKRLLAKEDFNNDKKDAGEIGAGHTVTALYELVPVGSKEGSAQTVDPLKYQKTQAVSSDDVMTVKLRYKEPDGDTSKLISRTISKSEVKNEPAGDFVWAAAVAEFGMLLRNSEFKGTATYEDVLKTAKANTGEDKFGLRAEFINLVQTAHSIAPSGNGQLQFK